jgi:hypothetical protein
LRFEKFAWVPKQAMLRHKEEGFIGARRIRAAEITKKFKIRSNYRCCISAQLPLEWPIAGLGMGMPKRELQHHAQAERHLMPWDWDWLSSWVPSFYGGKCQPHNRQYR